jgi:hypothetical protein
LEAPTNPLDWWREVHAGIVWYLEFRRKDVESELELDPPPPVRYVDTNTLETKLRDDLEMVDWCFDNIIPLSWNDSFWTKIRKLPLIIESHTRMLRIMHELLDQLMILQIHLATIRQTVETLQHREDTTLLGIQKMLAEMESLSWILDQPIEEQFSYSKLITLRSLLKKTQNQIRAWRFLCTA